MGVKKPVGASVAKVAESEVDEPGSVRKEAGDDVTGAKKNVTSQRGPGQAASNEHADGNVGQATDAFAKQR